MLGICYKPHVKTCQYGLLSVEIWKQIKCIFRNAFSIDDNLIMLYLQTLLELIMKLESIMKIMSSFLVLELIMMKERLVKNSINLHYLMWGINAREDKKVG